MNKVNKIFIIHRNERTDRKKEMDKLFNEESMVDFEYLKAIDGHEIPEEELTHVQGYFKGGDSIHSTKLKDKKGKFGAQQSHYMAVCYALDKIDKKEIQLTEDKPFVGIFEDDVDPIKPLKELTVEKLPENTGALMLAASMITLKRGYHPLSLGSENSEYLVPSACFCIMAVLYSEKCLRVLKTAYEANLRAAKVKIPRFPELNATVNMSDSPDIGMCAADVVTCLLQKWFLGVLSSKEQQDYSHIFDSVEKEHGKLSEDRRKYQNFYMVNPLLIQSLDTPSDLYFDHLGNPLIPEYNKVLKANVKQVPLSSKEQLREVIRLTTEALNYCSCQSENKTTEIKKNLLKFNNDFNEGRITYEELVSQLKGLCTN